MKLYQISQNDSFLLWRTHFVLGQFRNIRHWLFNVQLEHLLEQWHFPHSVCCLKSFDLNFSHFWNQIYHFLCHIRKWIMWNDILIEIKSFEFSREEKTLFLVAFQCHEKIMNVPANNQRNVLKCILEFYLFIFFLSLMSIEKDFHHTTVSIWTFVPFVLPFFTAIVCTNFQHLLLYSRSPDFMAFKLIYYLAHRKKTRE